MNVIKLKFDDKEVINKFTKLITKIDKNLNDSLSKSYQKSIDKVVDRYDKSLQSKPGRPAKTRSGELRKAVLYANKLKHNRMGIGDNDQLSRMAPYWRRVEYGYTGYLGKYMIGSFINLGGKPEPFDKKRYPYDIWKGELSNSPPIGPWDYGIVSTPIKPHMFYTESVSQIIRSTKAELRKGFKGAFIG